MTGRMRVARSPVGTSTAWRVPDHDAQRPIRVLLIGLTPGQLDAVRSGFEHADMQVASASYEDGPRAACKPEIDVAFLAYAAAGPSDAVLDSWGSDRRRPPLICLAEAPGERRRSIRAELRRRGADDCLLVHELSSATLATAAEGALDRRALKAELGELRQRFALSIRGANDGMWELDPSNGRLYFSQRWSELLGYEHEELKRHVDTWLGLVHPHDVRRVRSELEEALESPEPVFETEHRLRHADGSYRHVLVRGMVERVRSTGAARRMAGSMTDITTFRAREVAVVEQSKHDAVTDLPRKELLMQRLARAVELARTYDDYRFAVLMVSIDRFDMLHDSAGARGMDELLKHLARRLEQAAPPESLVGRFDTKRFVILLEDLEEEETGGPEGATRSADRIHDALRQPFRVGEEDIYVSVSIGLTSSARAYQRAEDVVTDVATALGHAGAAPNKGHEIFNTQMRIEALTMLRLEMAMRQAIEREEFQLYYQPIYSLMTERLAGFEALLRWVHPKRGMISPGEFIPVAESTGLIVPIGRWALGEAVRQLGIWYGNFNAKDLSISVNLSGKQTTDPKFLPAIDAALSVHDIPRGALKIELTESVLMENARSVTQLLNDLRERGVGIWVDDFGTGYSSLSYLHQFPVDGLKVDKSFVDMLAKESSGDAMVRTIVNLARNLRVDVVAEGIEEAEQAVALKNMGCALGQGYLWSPARPPDDLAPLLFSTYG